MGQYRKYSDEDVINYAKEVTSIAQLLRKLGLRVAGGSYDHIRKKIQILEIDTSHWKGQGWNKDHQMKDWSKYTKIEGLKKHLLKLRGWICENCKLDTWMGVPIPLECDHIDGDRTNNNLENLKILCCNCHALTPTWRGRGRKKGGKTST